MQKFILVAFLFVIIGCEKNRNKKSVEAKTDFTILKYDKNIFWVFENAKPTNLTEKDRIEIESILKIAIKEHNNNQRESLLEHNKQHPNYQWTETSLEIKMEKGYYRQYLPVIDENGDKLVWINFLCDYDESYEIEIPLIDDGGNCFFNIKINLTRKSYSEFRINSDA